MNDDPTLWKKIKIDFKNLDKDGLSGPEDGKVALHYEFCLPQDEDLWERVKKIDPTLNRQTAPGRSKCATTDWLCIGSTHQALHRKVLYNLARIPEIKEINPTYFE